jgi:hypothetical protein
MPDGTSFLIVESADRLNTTPEAAERSSDDRGTP